MGEGFHAGDVGVPEEDASGGAGGGEVAVVEPNEGEDVLAGVNGAEGGGALPFPKVDAAVIAAEGAPIRRPPQRCPPFGV